MKICIIGAGWYGCHLARILSDQNHEVTLVDKNPDIFMGISGKFGVRLHTGTHYPRSNETRKNCKQNFKKFFQYYPHLVVPMHSSIYSHGVTDSEGKPSKVGEAEFKKVCYEIKECKPVDRKAWEFSDLISSAWDVKEPSILLGTRLRATFKVLLEDAQVKTQCNFEVTKLERCEQGVIVHSKDTAETYDYVINATSFHGLLPTGKNLPFDLNVVYQPCLALVYEDTEPKPLPFSFIVLDGFFPCLMPRVQDDQISARHKEYLLTHAKWTIMGSYQTPEEAYNLLNELRKPDNQFIERHIRPKCEESINSFLPWMTKRFKYADQWQGEVLAKVATNTDFRSAITFEDERVLHIIPGKVSDIFSVAKEVTALIAQENILHNNGYQYIKGGVLDKGTQSGMGEILAPITSTDRNACALQTYSEIMKRIEADKVITEANQDRASLASFRSPIHNQSASQSRRNSDEYPKTDKDLSSSELDLDYDLGPIFKQTCQQLGSRYVQKY